MNLRQKYLFTVINIFWEVRMSLKWALTIFFSVVWMSIQILNLPKWDRVCKAGWLEGRGEKLMNHNTRSVFDFQITLQLQSLVLTSQIKEKLSLWKITCVSTGVFLFKEKDHFWWHFSKRNFEIKINFYCFSEFSCSV